MAGDVAGVGARHMIIHYHQKRHDTHAVCGVETVLADTQGWAVTCEACRASATFDARPLLQDWERARIGTHSAHWLLGVAQAILGRLGRGETRTIARARVDAAGFLQLVETIKRNVEIEEKRS